MAVLIDIVYLIALLAVSPVAIYRRLRYGRYRAGWANRFGRIIRKHPDKKCIWIHAVSVGEVNATTTLIKELENKFADYEIVISTTTDTGFARANALYGNRQNIFYFPMDFSATMKRAFKNIRPAMCLLIELEVWPNLVRIAKRNNVPIIVVNGRLSERSFKRYNLIKGITKKVFGNVTLALVQNDQYAERFRKVGVTNVIVTGSLKYDTSLITDRVEGSDILQNQLFGNNLKSLWVAGATGNDEEKIILDVYRRLIEQTQFADLGLVIVPRKPERFNEVADLIKKSGFDFLRYSELKSDPKLKIENTKWKIVLGDTMGDLRKFYSLAKIIFVGRSLVPMGGSDMMEAAALGKCTVFGPYAFNFKQTVDDLLKADGAILVRNGDELFNAMKKCLTDSGYAKRIAQNGREIIRKNQGATLRTVTQISKFLK